jgi:hypothetical protein
MPVGAVLFQGVVLLLPPAYFISDQFLQYPIGTSAKLECPTSSLEFCAFITILTGRAAFLSRTFAAHLTKGPQVFALPAPRSVHTLFRRANKVRMAGAFDGRFDVSRLPKRVCPKLDFFGRPHSSRSALRCSAELERCTACNRSANKMSCRW